MKTLHLATRITLTAMCLSSAAIPAYVLGAEQRLVPFGEFSASVATAQASALVGNAQTLDASKSYLRDLYGGVDVKAVTHSFVDANDTVFDCIPIRQQPGLRGWGSKPLPTPPRHISTPASGKQNLVAKLDGSAKDRFNNAMVCPAETIPMARVTLEELARFPSLDAFLRKKGGLPSHNAAATQAVDYSHYHYANSYQNVDNFGGESILSVWDPRLTAWQIGPIGIHSLSQQWYAGGTGDNRQTAEAGWTVDPNLKGTTLPVLFAYYTADNYGSTGCYDLRCGAFVQLDNSYGFRQALSSSTLNGQQSEIKIGYILGDGAWWLIINDTWIGYYPTTLYNGGQMSKNAQIIEFGGEVTGTEPSYWPPMGSGEFAIQGYGKAAYQRMIHYNTNTGSPDAALTAFQDAPSYYTTHIIYQPDGYWNEMLYFGGPGKPVTTPRPPPPPPPPKCNPPARNCLPN